MTGSVSDARQLPGAARELSVGFANLWRPEQLEVDDFQELLQWVALLRQLANAVLDPARRCAPELQTQKKAVPEGTA